MPRSAAAEQNVGMFSPPPHHLVHKKLTNQGEEQGSAHSPGLYMLALISHKPCWVNYDCMMPLSRISTSFLLEAQFLIL